MTDDGKYFINGSITEVETQKNLTEESKTNKRKEIVSQFGKDRRIDFYPEKMKHHVTVYTDIDCGYCRKLHAEMKDFNDLGIGISYLFWPRSGLNSPSFNKAVTAWCAVDKNQAMTQSQNGITLTPKQCDNPVAEHFNSGIKIGVRGTPNIVTDDGKLYPTYMSASDLLRRLEMVASQ
jgi:thiol:disulfide interchange protein DsbC